MKKLSDFIISYVTESSVGTGGSFYYMPGTSTTSTAPSTPVTTATSYSPSITSDNPDYNFQNRLGGMVKSKTKETQDLLNRMRRVAAKQEAGGGIDPGVASKIEELENELSPLAQTRIRSEEGRKLEAGIQRVKTGKQFSNLPSGMFKTTPKTPAEQEAYDAAKSAFDLMGKEGSEEAFEKSRQASAAVDAERKAKSRISPVYQVTQGDFQTATGQEYDPRNPQHRQLFFDLASRGAPTWSATAGVGEGPAYGSQAFYTMRGRPKDIPEFGTPEAWYDKETGQIARTTEKSREKTAEKEAIEKINDRENKLNSVTDFVVNWNYPNRPEPAPAPEPAQEPQDNFPFDVERGQFPIQQPEDNFPFDVERGQFPIFPKRASKFGQALNKAAENVIGSVGPKVSDFIKKNLAQTTPNAMREKLYGTTDVPGAVPVPDQERGQFPIFPEGEPEQDSTPEKEIQTVKLGTEVPEFKGYVVPESEEWNKLSDSEKLAMAAYALSRGEVHKFTGGRQQTKGGFLGLGGEKVNRFSEDNRGETPSETAYLNRVAKMLNQMLDSDEGKAKEYREFAPEIETGILQGESPVNLKSETPKSAKDYMDKVLLRKYRNPSKSVKQGVENSLSPEQLRQLFSGRGNLQGLDNFLSPEQIKQLRQSFSSQTQTNKQVKMAPNVRIELPPNFTDPAEWARNRLDPLQREEEDLEGIMGSRGVPGRELSIPDEEEPRRPQRRR